MTNLNIVLQQQAEPVAQRSDGMPISKMERELRRMLCIERHGRSAYMDDGKASFCGDKYCRSIDYMRESVESIKQAWYDAGVKKLAGAQPEQQAEPCQYCGLSECDPKCMWIEQAPQQQAEPVSQAVIAGALFDFMGWLTTRKERLVLSSTDNASPAADAIKDFAEMRGLLLDDAKVQDWQAYTAPPQRKPLSDEQIDDIWVEHGCEGEDAYGFARAIEAAHHIQEPKS